MIHLNSELNLFETLLQTKGVVGQVHFQVTSFQFCPCCEGRRVGWGVALPLGLNACLFPQWSGWPFSEEVTFEQGPTGSEGVGLWLLGAGRRAAVTL